MNKSAGTFVADATAGGTGGTYTFSYTGSGDSYTYSNGIGLNQSQLADYLSALMGKAGVNSTSVAGDELTANYNSSGPSSFTFTTDVPAAPTATKASFQAAVTSGPLAGQHAADRVEVDWNAPSNPDVATYKVYRADVAKDGTVGTFGPVGTVIAANTADSTTSTSGGTTFYDTTVAPGHTYAYEVSAVGDSAEGPVSNQAQATDPAASQPGAVPGAPTISDVRANDGGTAFQMGQGDTIQMAFNEPMKSNALDGASFRVSDGVNAGTIAIGTNAKYAWLPAGTYNGVTVRADQAAQIVLTGALQNPSPASGSVNYPAKITNVTSGVQDADGGLTLSLASGDTTINADQPITVQDTTPPSVTTSGATAVGGTVDFVANEVLQPGSVDASDFAITTGSVSGATLGADGKTITVTFTGAGTGDKVSMAANSVKDLAGNDGPTSAVVANLS